MNWTPREELQKLICYDTLKKKKSKLSSLLILIIIISNERHTILHFYAI